MKALLIVGILAACFGVATTVASRKESGTCPFCDGVAVRNTSTTGMHECTNCHREFQSWMADPKFRRQAMEQVQREHDVTE